MFIMSLFFSLNIPYSSRQTVSVLEDGEGSPKFVVGVAGLLCFGVGGNGEIGVGINFYVYCLG
jgi:hypothetical protein